MSRFAEFWESLMAPFVYKTAHAAEKGGAALAVTGGLTATDWAAFGGLVIAALGYLTSQWINLYFQRKQDRRRQVEHELRITLRNSGNELHDQGAEE
jgi:hypothetical protein